MRIALLVDSFPRSSQPFVVNHVLGLLARGHDVEVYAEHLPGLNDHHEQAVDLTNITTYTPIPLDKPQRVCEAIRLIKNTNTHEIPKLLQVSNPFKFGRDAITLRPLFHLAPMLGKEFDIIHCHFGPKGQMGAILKQLDVAGKLVVSIHGFGIRQAKKYPNQYQRLLENADLFFANSEYTQQQLLDVGAVEKQVVHQPLGINTSQIPFKWDDELACSSEGRETIHLITVARLVDLKGIDYAIRAVVELIERSEVNINYHIVGDGPQRKTLKSLATDLGASDSVVFHGHRQRSEVIEMLTKADIFVLPSLEEAFGMVLLEAQAVGLPIVATDVGGIPEVLNVGNSGHLVPPADCTRLANSIQRILNSRDKWRSFGKNGREYVRSNFNSERMNDSITNHYNILIREGRKSN